MQPCIRWRYCERIVSTYWWDPGIGKSTLLLQICASLSQKKKVLYITGEESLSQTKLRAERLDEDSSELQVLAETDLEVIYQTVKEEQPDLLVVDSIQTIYHPEISSALRFCFTSS
ncbi:AAA family ATPase [Staphylococcus aureus]|nr:AAA family ATPase [Staphylococcus aureus]